jgi:hypothetical protein
VAVTQTGSAVVVESGSTSEISQAVTVPTDADLCVVYTTGYNYGSGEPAHVEMNWDGDDDVVDFTLIDSAIYIHDGDVQAEAWYYVNPPTGNQTLYFRVESCSEGFTRVIVFYKGVDTTDPIGSTETHDMNAPGDSEITTSLAACPAGDLATVIVYAWRQTPDVDPSGYGQTAVNESTYNGAGCGVCYEDGETALRFENCYYTAYVAFVIQAGVGGVDLGSIAMHHYRMMRN